MKIRQVLCAAMALTAVAFAKPLHFTILGVSLDMSEAEAARKIGAAERVPALPLGLGEQLDGNGGTVFASKGAITCIAGADLLVNQKTHLKNGASAAEVERTLGPPLLKEGSTYWAYPDFLFVEFYAQSAGPALRGRVEFFQLGTHPLGQRLAIHDVFEGMLASALPTQGKKQYSPTIFDYPWGRVRLSADRRRVALVTGDKIVLDATLSDETIFFEVGQPLDREVPLLGKPFRRVKLADGSEVLYYRGAVRATVSAGKVRLLSLGLER